MTIYRFDQIAENIRVPVIPSDTDLDRYVGLEHLDPESLRLRRWGNPSEVIGQKLRFWKGDIIYGKRRAYQRKLAVADFDGICSAHAFVLRAKSAVCLPEFFPFFLQSELFHQRALEISVGSLSPTINWSTLAKQEFPLPPLDEQRGIADLLWAVDDAIQESSALIQSINQMIVSYRDSFFNDSHGWKKEQLGKLYEIKLGKMVSPKSRQGISPRPFMSNANVQWGKIDLTEEVKQMDFTDEEFEKNRLRYGDLLVCEGGEVGRSAIWRDELPECGYQKAIHRLRPITNDLPPEVLLQFMFFAARRGLFVKFTGQSTIAHLPAERLRLIEILIPPKEKQEEFLNTMCEVDSSRLAAEQHLEETKKLLKAMLTKYIG
jgi:type I restriction enzyme S subunit